MTREDALAKIKKLLQRKGRTDEEADTAQIIAAALADKHGWDLSKIDLDESPAALAIKHEVFGTWAKCPPEAEYAGAILKRFFNLSILHQQGYVTKIIAAGTDLHLQIGRYIFDFLLGEFRRAWTRRRGRCKNRKQFIYGCFCALYQKLREQHTLEEKTMALQISARSKREQYLKDNFGDLSTSSLEPKQRRSAARHYGYQAGSEIEIRKGIEGDFTESPRLGTAPKQIGFNGLL